MGEALIDAARRRLGPLGSQLFEARHWVELALTAGGNAGPVTRVTGAGATIEAAIEEAAAKLERGKDA
ncbi:hypothetical protein [Pedomonas sp. V897]|uniref:hypothetical protein n=1 Tax=Pedomonas sp. V897 TaxID=3446482 RepID=UPI003EDF6811